ncbi:MAG: endolytic transglycosylase MltG [Acidobacteria bacterium]|nr:MAG: endolytic transglycosylase MltG [Acidobacteriota bacterium]
MIRRFFLLAVVVAALGAGAWWFLQYSLSQPYKGYEAPEQFVEIAQGDGSRSIARKLVDAGVVRDEWSFRAALWQSGAARRLKAGEYRFDRPLAVRQVVDMLARGAVYLRQVTFREGLTIREMSRVYEAHCLGTAASFVKAAGDAALGRDLDPRAPDREGYLFPETYSLPRRSAASDLVKMMVGRFRNVFDEGLQAELRRQGRDLREAVTLASLVEKESARAEERPLIAGVYRQRLKIGMALQCDPTVIYALDRAGRYKGNLTKEGLAFDSPYNTYRNPGLPPGPIAAPGRGALAAAIRPADVDYLYFVSRNDGSHAFARTLDEHNRNVHKYQVLYFRQKRLETAGQGTKH